MSRRLRLAVFDLDGTLVDSRHNITRAVLECAAVCGLTAPPLEIMPRVIGLSLDEALAQLFPAASPAQLIDLDKTYRACFIRYRTEPDFDEPLFEGTQGLLTALDREGILLAIATGKARRGVDYVLNRHGLTGRFLSIQTPDVAPGKPHPGMVLQAMAEVGADSDATVVIGDTSYDILMARAAGAAAIGVSWGNHAAADLHAAGAHCLIDRMSDLFQAVHELTLTPTAKRAVSAPGGSS
jgi:phosphoglycolate phosphatase